MTTWIAGVTALAISPILAAWTVTLPATTGNSRWWKPARTRFRQWSPVAALAVALSVVATTLAPWPAWLLFAIGGAVLIVIDLQHHLLPARLGYPLAGAVAAALIVASLKSGDWPALARAGAAALAVGGVWMIAWLLVPSAVGRGDLRMQPLCAALAGYQSWTTVLAAQLAMAVISVLVVGLLVVRRRASARDPLPLGPGLIIGTFAAVLAS